MADVVAAAPAAGGAPVAVEPPPVDLSDEYVSELLGYDMERLLGEERSQEAERARLEEEALQVTAARLDSFLESAGHVRVYAERLRETAASLERVRKDIEAMKRSNDSYLHEVQQISMLQAQNRQLLSHHSKLLDLLEVPQLMETCVLNGAYDEALDLQASVRQLSLAAGETGMARTVDLQCAQVARRALDRLLTRLSGDVGLPECLRIVGYLRRLDIFDEAELRRRFMECRETWFSNLVADLPRDSPVEHLKRLADLHRVQAGDLTTQYRAIFSDEEGAAAAAQAALARVEGLLAAAVVGIPQLRDGASVAAVADAVGATAAAAARSGADVSPLLAPLLAEAIAGVVERALAGALLALREGLDLSRWCSSEAAAAPLERPGAVPLSEPLPPPAALMDHPALAIYCNGLLGALNEARHYPARVVEARVLGALREALQEAGEEMLRRAPRPGAKDGPGPSAAAFERTVTAFARVLLPHVATAADRVYPPSGGSALRARELAAKLLAAVRRLRPLPVRPAGIARSPLISAAPVPAPPTRSDSMDAALLDSA